MNKEIDLEIGKDGKVQVHVKGIKGPKCMEYTQLFETIIGGEITSSEHTWEYHETVSENNNIDIEY